MKHQTAFNVFTLLILIAGCAPEQRSSVDENASDFDSINAVLATHVAAVNSSDSAANLADFADDIVYLPPNQPPIRGKQALASFVGPFFETFDAELEMVPEETVVSGDWAFQWGNFTNTIVAQNSSDTTFMDAKWIYLYQRQSDGSWKIARDIYNSNLPPAPNE